MKRLLVCSLAVLCMVLAGCAGNQREESNPPEQKDTQQEVHDNESGAGTQADKQQEIPGNEPGTPPQAETPAEPEGGAFAGMWQDPNTPQCSMNISSGDSYAIEIVWSSSSQESAVWQLEGTYDETWGGIAYVGAKYGETTDADGNSERTPAQDREEITGLIYFEDDGTLHWIDDFDHAGDNLSFERA